MKLFYSDDWVTIYHGDCRDSKIHAQVLITDPPYGVEFSGKATKHTTQKLGGYESGVDDGQLGPSIIASLLPHVRRAAVFTGNRLLHDYPKPRDVGCVYCPSGAGIGPWGFTCFHPILFYGPRASNTLRPTSIQSFAISDKLGHPCPKPIEWLTWLVGMVSLPGELIIDPFAGSGTTLRAAKDLGRKSIGIESEELYCEIAARRMSQEVFNFA